MVDDAAVSLQDRRVRLGHAGRGLGGRPRLLVPPDARVVGVPGRAAEAAVVHEEQAGAQEEDEKHRDPVALTRRHREDAEKREPPLRWTAFGCARVRVTPGARQPLT